MKGGNNPLKLYLLDANERIIDAPPTKDVLSLIQDLKLKDTDTIEGALVVSKRYTSIMDNVRYIAVSDRDNDHAFYLYRKTMAEVQDRELIFDGKESFWDDLAGSYIKDKRPGTMLAPDLVKLILSDTRWNVDFVDSGFTETLDTNFYYQSRSDALSSVMSAMTIDIVPMINIEGNTITRRYVNLYLQAGGDNGRRFVYGKNALSVVKKTDDSQVFTALVGRGKSIEQTSTDTGTGVTTTYNTPKINFADVEWSKAAGDPVDKPKGQEYVEWPEATKLYGYSSGDPRIGIVEFADDDDPEQLLKDTWDQLQTVGVPSVQFSATVGDVGYLNKGETVTIVNYVKGIAYKTRVTELKWNRLAEAKSQLTIGDKLVQNANERMASIAMQQSSTAIQAATQTIEKQVANLVTVTNSLGVNVSWSKDGTLPPEPKEGDIVYIRNDDGTITMKSYKDGQWVIIVDDTTGQQIQKKVDAKIAQLDADMSAADANLQVAKQDVADLQIKLKANDDAQAQLSKDLSENSTILEKAQADIVTNAEDLTALDAKLKANDDAQAQLQDDLAANTKVQDQLKNDLAANSQQVTQNKADVDAALDTVNKTLTQAQTDAETAVKNADLAVTNAQSAVEASGLASTTANSANDAATAAKDLATSTANSFATVQSQAATAASDAATALDQAKSALDTANGVSDNYTSLKQIVDDTSGTIKTLATSESVDAVSGRVTTAQSLAEQTANGLTLKADSSTVDTLSDTVKQQGIDLKAAQGELALKLTQSDLTTGLNGYATQTWAQNQITATAQGWETQLSSVQSQYNNLTIGARNYIRNSDFETSNISGKDLSVMPKGSADIIAATYSYPTPFGTHMLRISSDDTTDSLDQYASYNLDSPVSLKTGETWTYSYYYAIAGSARGQASDFINDDSGGVIGNGSMGHDARETTGDQTTWHRFVKTFTVDRDRVATRLRFGFVKTSLSHGWVCIDNIQLEKSSIVSDYHPAPEDSATYTDTKVADLKLTVDGLTGTFAKQTDLESTNSQLKLTSDGLGFITSATGVKGEKVTQVIADVNGIKNTMTGDGGYTTRIQNLEGFQQTATKALGDAATTSQLTQLSNQLTSTIGNISAAGSNLVVDGGFESGKTNGLPSLYSGTSGDRPAPSGTWAAYLYANNMQTNDDKTWYWTLPKPITLQVGHTYIMSYDYCVSGGIVGTASDWPIDDTGSVLFGLAMEHQAHTIDADTTQRKWHRFVGKPYTATKNVSILKLRFGFVATWSGGGWKAIDNIQIQESKVATPYQPAPNENSSTFTQLQNQIDLRTIVAGKVTAALNLSNDGGGTVTIRGASLYVTAASHFDDASIQSASIASLDATKITSGSISSDRLATTKLNADNITSGSISAERLATTKLNASNITSGSINAGLITTGVLSADMILGGTFDASKMTVKNINAGSITSGSIATALLASTQINADNITSGSIAAARIATTALSATNIVSGTLDVGKLTVKNLSADLIASGTIDASKIAVKNLSASNIIGGTLDASTMTVKNIDAAAITTGTLNAASLNVVGLNASAITTGTISGANLAINLNSGEVLFTKGSIKSIDGHLNIDVNDGTFAQTDGTKGMMFAKGNLYLSSESWWDKVSNPDAAPKPDYGFIGYTDTVLTARGFGVIGRDALTLGLTDNGNPGMEYTSSPVITMDRSNVTLDFSGELATIQAGKEFTISTNPYYNVGQTPGIQIGSNVDRSGIGDRVFIDGSYVYIPSAYSRTSSGSANLIVAADGALVRTSSATKYKSNIERFRNTDMGEALLNLPQAHWYNKQDMQRYVDDQQHYSMPELDYGMIAEDLAAAGLEDLVVRGDDGQLEDIRYDRMTPALLPLLAKMKQEIEELKSAAKSA